MITLVSNGSALDPPGLVRLALARGWIQSESVTNADLVVSDVSRRNRNWRLNTGRGGIFVKQGLGIDRKQSVQSEARAYKRLSSGPLRRWLPLFIGYDDATVALAVEIVRGARDLRQHHARTGDFSVTLARELGQALATLHRLPTRLGEVWHATMPWALRIAEPSLRTWSDSSGANQALLQTVQRHKFGKKLARLQQNWRAESLVHGDLKWDNILLSYKRGILRLAIIDWELHGAGDPAWDLATILSEPLTFWTLSIPAIEGVVSANVDLARYPLRRVARGTYAFWQAYTAGAGLSPDDARVRLRRAIAYLGPRLLQTAYEQGQGLARMTPNLGAMIQLAANVLDAPEDAAIQLLGLPPNEVVE